MESQIKQLKLSATNIKGTLIRGNKELKKLRVKERNLFNRQRISAKRLQKESFVEGGIPGSGMVAGAARRMAAPAMSLFDKLKEFAGTILLGILVNNLPSIIKRVEKLIDDNRWLIKTVGDVFNWLGGLFQVLVDIYNFFNPAKKAQLEKEKKELNDALNSLVSGIDGIEGEAKSADAAVDEFVGDQLREKNPEQVRSDVVTAFKGGGLTGEDFTRNRFAISISRRDKDDPVKLNVPGIGTFERAKDTNIFGRLFNRNGMKETATDIYGYEITPEEFYKRARIGYDVAEGVDTDIIKDLKAAGIQGLSRGGTVRPSSSSSGGSFPGESAAARKARESTQSFSTFERNTLNQSGLLMVQNENNERFEEMIENFKTLRELSEPKRGGTPPGGGGTPLGTLPPPDPNAKGSIITFDSAQGRDRSGEPGVDFSFADIYRNYAIFPGKVVEVGSYYGSGYGRHVTVRSKDSNGKEFDALYAHFGNFAVREGDTVHAGDYLGSVGWDPVTDTKMPGAGGMTGPHTSVDFYEPNARPGIVTPAYSGKEKLISLILNSANKDVKNLKPLTPAVTPKSTNGGQKVSSISQSFDDGGSEVVMIMAQQPVIVPGPTRYITRTRTQTMPVPVQIAPKSSGLRSLV